MVNQLMGKTDPTIAWDLPHEILLDLIGICIGGHSQAIAQTLHMGIHNDTATDPKSRTQHNIGRLTGHTGQLQEFLHAFRNSFFERLNDPSGRPYQILGLVPKKPRASYDLLQLSLIRLGHVAGCRIALKKLRRDPIHAHICALSGEDGGNEKLKRIVVMKSAFGVGIFFVQSPEDLSDPMFFLGFLPGCGFLWTHDRHSSYHRRTKGHPMRKIKTVALLVLLGAFFSLLFHSTAEATLKHKKETGKKCIFCHSRIPEPEEKDPQLNGEGEKFRENDYSLTQDQQD